MNGKKMVYKAAKIAWMHSHLFMRFIPKVQFRSKFAFFEICERENSIFNEFCPEKKNNRFSTVHSCYTEIDDLITDFPIGYTDKLSRKESFEIHEIEFSKKKIEIQTFIVQIGLCGYAYVFGCVRMRMCVAN